MKAFKTYREQNPGKTYLDFKKYADGGITDQRTDHPIGKPKLPDPKMIRQDRLIDLGGSPAEDITYEERYKRGKRERTQQDWKSLLHGINSTFGTAASLASFIYGGGWSLTRLLNGNKSSTIGQQLSKYVLPSNTIDTAADIAAFVEEPNTETGTEIVGGILLGKERDFSKVSRQAAELVQQVQSINNTFADGGEIPPSNKPIIPEEPQPYKGKLYKDRYGRKYTESQLDDYYDNSTDEIDRFTGKPFVRGLKPVGDIEDAANVTPVGDAISIYDAYSSAKNKDWLGTGLALFSVLPFVPSSVNKVKRAVPTVNKNLTNNLLNKQFEQESKELALRTKTVNEVYNTVERLMDDPAYIRRAEQVREQFGTDYTVPYADAFIAYNLDPSDLPHVKVLDDQLSASKAGMMTKHNKNSFTYGISKLDHNIPNVTEHEMSHYIDMLQTGDYLNAEAGNNMFYQMSKDLDKKVDSRDKYFSNPSEQKAHMNQLREYMFQNGMIDSRGDTVSDKMMKNVLNKIKGIDGMQGIFRASEQFKSIKTYTKWFNSIPLLGVGAAAVYSNNQE